MPTVELITEINRYDKQGKNYGILVSVVLFSLNGKFTYAIIFQKVVKYTKMILS